MKVRQRNQENKNEKARWQDERAYEDQQRQLRNQ